MIGLQKLAGILAICEGLIYIVDFVYFGAFWSYPADGSAAEKMAHLAENQMLFSMIYFLMYAVFGVVWVGLVIASGMVSNIGLAQAIALKDINPEKALDMWATVSVITESIGGGNELVGGLWVLLISAAAIQEGWLPRALNYLEYFLGIAGIATIYPNELFTEIFGVLQIVWFIWLGVCLLTQKNTDKLILRGN
jgi:hypothetical protein